MQMPFLVEKSSKRSTKAKIDTGVCVNNTVILCCIAWGNGWTRNGDILWCCWYKLTLKDLDPFGPIWTDLDQFGPIWTNLDLGQGDLDQFGQETPRVRDSSATAAGVGEERHQRGQPCIYRCRLMCVLRRSNQILATASAAKKRPS